MKNFFKELFTINSLVFFLAVIVAFLLVWQASKSALENYELQQQVDDLASQVELLELENQLIGYNIEYYKTDSYLELAARENLNLKAPGERVLYVPKLTQEESSNISDSSAKEQAEQTKSNIEQWLDFFLGHKAS